MVWCCSSDKVAFDWLEMENSATSLRVECGPQL